jgi:hypothetical protein
MFDKETLLRNCTSETFGVFMLQKIKFLNVQNVETPRCDNLTYSGTNVVDGTEYANEALAVDVKSAFTDTKIESRKVVRFERVIDASPQFMIIYVLKSAILTQISLVLVSPLMVMVKICSPTRMMENSQ